MAGIIWGVTGEPECAPAGKMRDPQFGDFSAGLCAGFQRFRRVLCGTAAVTGNGAHID